MSDKIKKILIAPDSFKDCLSSGEVAGFLAEGIMGSGISPEITIFPVADGGEGSAGCIAFHKGGSWIELEVMDPLCRPVSSKYLVMSDEKTAVIELAAASGLELLSAQDRNPLNTSTYGTGQLICDAMDRGLKNIRLTIGGSATVDGGAGIASALGFRFFDKNRKNIDHLSGGNLKDICYIDRKNVHPLFSETQINIAYDVKNILNGEEGAARIYAPQKGADNRGVALLEAGLNHLSSVIYKDTGFNADDHQGTGAAGGASLFILAYGNGALSKGVDLILELTGFSDALHKAGLIITGEGKIDSQTAYGKVVSSIADMAVKKKIPVAVVAGVIEGDNEYVKQALGVRKLYSVRELADDEYDSFENAGVYLQEIGRIIAKEVINNL